MVTAVTFWPYLGGDRGLGAWLKGGGVRLWLMASSVPVILLLLLPSGLSFGLAIGCLVSGLLFVMYIFKRLGGFTGDTYGALNEFVETAGLVTGAYIIVGMG